MTPLARACMFGSRDRVLSEIRAAGTPAPSPYGLTWFVSPLHVAARYGNVAAIAVLRDSGVNVDAQDEYGQTALFYALSSVTGKTNMSALIALLETRNGRRGTDPTIRTLSGQEPLLIALSKDDNAAARALIRYGADLYATTRTTVAGQQVVERPLADYASESLLSALRRS